MCELSLQSLSPPDPQYAVTTIPSSAVLSGQEMCSPQSPV